MRDNPRTTVVSAVAGVVLLGAMFAFTVLVPKIGDDDSEAAAAETSETSETSGAAQTPSGPIELPDQLTGDLVAVDLGTLPPALAQNFGDIEALKTQEAAIQDGLDGVFGVPGAFRVYAATDGSAIAQMTALDKAPGLFTPDALPIDPDVLGVTRAQSELVKADGAICSVNWGEEVAAGAEVPATPPQAIRCQLGAGERTYELTAQGMTVDEAVAVLQDVATA